MKGARQWHLVSLRLGGFGIGCCTYLLASYFMFPGAGWLLLPTIVSGLMCSSLMIRE